MLLPCWGVAYIAQGMRRAFPWCTVRTTTASRVLDILQACLHCRLSDALNTSTRQGVGMCGARGAHDVCIAHAQACFGHVQVIVK